mmetsp:Transcript_35399/g.100233  ORF Transcript_35399/g.100233 Transcript_35399/m.100233 type:complete len:107 (-) Transcript_35399:205-525(-)
MTRPTAAQYYQLGVHNHYGTQHLSSVAPTENEFVGATRLVIRVFFWWLRDANLTLALSEAQQIGGIAQMQCVVPCCWGSAPAVVGCMNACPAEGGLGPRLMCAFPC